MKRRDPNLNLKGIETSSLLRHRRRVKSKVDIIHEFMN